MFARRVVAPGLIRRAARVAAFCSVLIAGASHPALPPALAAGSQPSPQIAGTVVDTTGGVIGGAAVTLRTTAGELQTVSDSAGNFAFDSVPVGPATLTIRFDGFAPVTLAVAAPRRDLRIVLHPDPVAEAVTVRGVAATALRSTTATGTDTPLLDVPQSVSAITHDLIVDQTMRGMADVVNYVPGVGMAQGEGHRDAPIFRGNTSTADFFVNGVRDDTQYLRDLYNVERVEVLKGPNGMMFGRGGVGGVINSVTRRADWNPARELLVQGGSWGHRRLTADVGDSVTNTVAARLTALYENSGTYRDHVDIERYGINPTVAFAIGAGTIVRAGYEFFHDERTTDRGVPSFQGRPLETEPSAFFGSVNLNTARITVNAVSASLEHTIRPGVTLRNRFRYADYDKFYENLLPGDVDAARATVALTGYNSGTDRQNLFNQTDVVLTRRTGRIGHTFMAGVEIGRQVTDNRRLTAFFPSIGPGTTSVRVPLSDPTTSLPVDFRGAGSDANNHGVATVAAVFAQDQIALSRQVHAIVGLRYDRFAVDLLDRRTNSELTSTDGLLSPRLALVYKPLAPVSVYASYTQSHLPRAGEQLASLSPSNQALDPEDFRNYEVGLKWELPTGLSFTTAVYRLDHGNLVVRDPVDPTLSHLVDAERTRGVELEVTGTFMDRWSVHGGYARQDGEITRSLSAAVAAGARLAQVPRHSFSLWNRYEVSSRWALGLGVISRSDSFVATDNRVVLPGFTRVDAAVFFRVTPQIRAQLNVENLFDERYYWAAHSNNNIAPGSPRAVRIGLMTRF